MRRAPSPAQFFLEYDPSDMMCPELLKQGFVHSAPTQIENGRERWEVWFAGAREEIQPRIETVMASRRRRVGRIHRHAGQRY